MAVGSIAHPAVGTKSFLVMSTPTGWPIDQFRIDEEELRSPGVDNRRWRTVSVQHQEIALTTLMDFDTYANAIIAARDYIRMKTGDPVTVTVTIAGRSYRFSNVHILEVAPQAFPGGMYGAGATAGSTAHVQCQWVMILMDTTATGS